MLKAITIQQMVEKSRPQLNTIQNPAVRFAAQTLIELAYQGGVLIRITDGTRTMAEQQRIFNQGRTPESKARGEKIVSNARPGDSFHNWDMAIDFVLYESGYDMNADLDKDGIKDWLEVVACAKHIGFEWGGDWTSFKDYPHFQMTFGLSIKRLKAGERPTAKQVSDMMHRIEKIRIVLEEPNMADTKQLEEKMAIMDKKLAEVAEAQAQLIATQKKLVAYTNLDGKQPLPKWSTDMLWKAKQSGVITTTADKSTDAVIFLQIMDNIGLLDPKVIAHLKEVAGPKEDKK